MAIASPDMGGNVEGGLSVNNPKVPENMVQPIVEETQRELANLRGAFYPVEVNGRVGLMPLEYVGEHPGIGHIWRGRDGVLVYQDESGKLKVLLLSMSPEEKMKFWEQVEKDKDLEELVYGEWGSLEALPNYLWNELMGVRGEFEYFTGMKLPPTESDSVIGGIAWAKVGSVPEKYKEPTKPEVDLLKLPYPVQVQLLNLLKKVDESDLDKQTKQRSKVIVFLAALSVVDSSWEEKLKKVYDEQIIKEISFRYKIIKKVEQSGLPENVKKVLLDYLDDPKKGLEIDDKLYESLLKIAIEHYYDEIGGVAAMMIASSPEYSKQTLNYIKDVIQNSLPKDILSKIEKGEDLTSDEFLKALKVIFDKEPWVLYITYVLVTNQPDVGKYIQSNNILEFVISLLGFERDIQRFFPDYLEEMADRLGKGSTNNPSLMESYAINLLKALGKEAERVQKEAERVQKEAERVQKEAERVHKEMVEASLRTYRGALELLFDKLNLPNKFWIDLFVTNDKKEAINLLLEAFQDEYPFLNIEKIYQSEPFRAFVELLAYGTNSSIYKKLKEKDSSITFEDSIRRVSELLAQEILKYSNKELSAEELKKLRNIILDLVLIVEGIENNVRGFYYVVAKKIVENPDRFNKEVVEAAKQFIDNFYEQAQNPGALDIAVKVLNNPNNKPEAYQIAGDVLKRLLGV